METARNPGKARLSVIAAATLVFAGIALGGIRGPGKYSRVAIFDRWGASYLYSGVYLMPISEKAKGSLLAFNGKPVLVDVQEVDYPAIADGVITKLTVIGVPPESSIESPLQYPELGDLTLRVFPGSLEQTRLALELRNNGTIRRELDMDALGSTIFVKKSSNDCQEGANLLKCFNPADGPSYALITRCSLALLDEHPESCKLENQGFSLARRGVLPTSLSPGENTRIELIFQLSPGEYEFLAGYGGGVHDVRPLVSNAVDFDVDQTGKAHLVTR